tara:strand:- start:1135 stop:1314 length:180 start_codon:yes stop_codon:yes gene_type:complete
MQQRLTSRSKSGSPIQIIIKGLIIISFLVLAFYLVDKINFPSPQKEIKEDVSDKIIKLN